MENAFNIEEKINSAASQNYGFDKTKLTLGLLIDLERANKMRKKQQQRMKDFDALVAKMQANESQDMLANESVSDSVYAQVPLRHIKGHLTYEAFDFVEFQFNSYELDESKNKNKLSNLAKFLADHPNTLVKLVGYADISGVIEHNLILSQKRADSVKEYLHNNYEIDNNRMLAVGAGETLQFSSDDYTYNRVTQILILE
jgi:outer membrane protein OmpA-like peptidoglycan-associated protein